MNPMDNTTVEQAAIYLDGVERLTFTLGDRPDDELLHSPVTLPDGVVKTWADTTAEDLRCMAAYMQRHAQAARDLYGLTAHEPMWDKG